MRRFERPTGRLRKSSGGWDAKPDHGVEALQVFDLKSETRMADQGALGQAGAKAPTHSPETEAVSSGRTSPGERRGGTARRSASSPCARGARHAWLMRV